MLGEVALGTLTHPAPPGACGPRSCLSSPPPPRRRRWPFWWPACGHFGRARGSSAPLWFVAALAARAFPLGLRASRRRRPELGFSPSSSTAPPGAGGAGGPARFDGSRVCRHRPRPRLRSPSPRLAIGRDPRPGAPDLVSFRGARVPKFGSLFGPVFGPPGPVLFCGPPPFRKKLLGPDPKASFPPGPPWREPGGRRPCRRRAAGRERNFQESLVPVRLRGFRPEPPALHPQAGGGGQNFQRLSPPSRHAATPSRVRARPRDAGRQLRDDLADGQRQRAGRHPPQRRSSHRPRLQVTVLGGFPRMPR